MHFECYKVYFSALNMVLPLPVDVIFARWLFDGGEPLLVSMKGATDTVNNNGMADAMSRSRSEQWQGEEIH